MGKDKVTLTYKKGRLKIMLGKKELPLYRIVDPPLIVLSSDEPPTLRFELLIDNLEIDELQAIASYTTVEELKADAQEPKKEN